MKINPFIHNSPNYYLSIDKNRGYADFIFSDSVSLEVVNNAFLDLIKHPSFRHNMDACYDYSDAIIETTMQEVEKHAQFVGQYTDKRGGHYKLALVSNETLNSALLNVYKLLISKTSIEVEVFGSRRQALNWLNKRN